MKSVKEIQAAIEKLSLSERAELTKWFNGSETDDWDKQMTADFGPSGRYEHVPDRVKKESKSDPLGELP